MKKLVLSLLFPLLATSLLAQKTAKEEIAENKNLAAANYLAYSEPTQPLTPAPKGYEPFYISSYARHGSRWLISPSQYDNVLNTLKDAHQKGLLTAKGEEVLEKLNRFYPTTQNRLGELTSVGERQHHGIGKRLTQNFPEVFSGNAQVDGRSTTVIRCILSMEAEMEELAAFNKNIVFHNDVSESLQYYLNQSANDFIKALRDKGNALHQKDIQEMTHPRRLMELLFKDQEYVYNNLNAVDFMRKMFDIASNMQSHDTDIDFWDLFTAEEAYDQWKINNRGWYMTYGTSPITNGLTVFSQENLLANILATADTLVNRRDYHGATMRFGHESCLLPLAGLLELGNCGKSYSLDELDTEWRCYNYFPMASNIQLIFYREKATKKNPNPTGEILVKALLNEKEVTLPAQTDNYPYYKWSDLSKYYAEKLAHYRAQLIHK